MPAPLPLTPAKAPASASPAAGEEGPGPCFPAGERGERAGALLAELSAAARGAYDEGELRRRAVSILRAALDGARADVRARFETGALGGVETARALSAAADAVVGALHAFTLHHVLRDHNPTDAERLALVAVGGYGRGVLAPFSDLDLLFLRPWKPVPHGESVAEFMLYTLWDLGLKVGHASRTVDETLRLAKTDLSIKTGLLDARPLAGDEKLFEDLQQRFRREVARGTGRAFAEARLAERDARHVAAGASRYLVEPNIKNGKGGLRDLNTLLWIAKYLNPEEPAELSATEYFDGAEMAQLRRCYDRLWRVRHHLHWAAGRAEERLGFDLQPEVARRMGWVQGGRCGTAGVERFMRRYFVNAREVGALTRVFCAKLEAERTKAKPSGLSRLLPEPLRPGRVDVPGFRVIGGRLAVEDGEVFARDPVNLLRLFRTADARDLDLHPQALALARRALPCITRRVRRDPEAARVFLDVLARGRQPFRTLSLMNDAGVLGRFVPEFGRIVSRTQLDRHHAYTVDEHTLRMTGLLADIAGGREAEAHPLATALLPRIADREALALAVLLHDVGKGGDGGQLAAGARHARAACERLGLGADRVELVAWLVQHHLLLSDCAQRRDVGDPGTVAAFAEAVGGLERLRLLLVLTVADIRSVGPGVWNAWKGQLMRELYAAAEAVFRGGRGADPASAFRRGRADAAEAARAALLEAQPEFAVLTVAMDDGYFTEFGAEEHQAHARLLAQAAVCGAAAAVRLRPERNVTEAVVAAADRPGLFADLAEALTAEGANVLAARLNTARGGQVLDVFQLQDGTGAPWGDQDPGAGERLVGRLEAAAAGDLFGRRSARRAGKGPVIAPLVTVDADSSEDAAIIEVSGRDRPGVLAELARALADSGLSVSSAHIDGSGLRLADAFYVTDPAGAKPDRPALERARAALAGVLAEPVALAGASGAL
ncbi:MAG: [protein-PII] uridylyltransferase [Proteobacteria bacterium]|nr:[protein-PII] uridylyltransferase [Pseudomonadota bacterium]